MIQTGSVQHTNCLSFYFIFFVVVVFYFWIHFFIFWREGRCRLKGRPNFHTLVPNEFKDNRHK